MPEPMPTTAPRQEPMDDGFKPLPASAPKVAARPAVLTVEKPVVAPRKYRGYSRATVLGLLLAVSATVTIILILINDSTPLEILQGFLAKLAASLIR